MSDERKKRIYQFFFFFIYTHLPLITILHIHFSEKKVTDVLKQT